MIWGTFTMWYIAVGIIATAIFTVCALIGGAFDLVFMLKELLQLGADESDDGRVPDSR